MENIENIELIKETRIHEKILIGLIKAIGYGLGGVTTLPHFLMNGFHPTAHGFSQQSFHYIENNTKVYRSFEAKDKFITSYKGFMTLNQYLINSTEFHPHRNCLGRRVLIDKKEQYDKINNKNIIKYVFGEFRWKTYSQVLFEMQNISKNLIDLGFNSEVKMGLFANTSPEWLTMTFSLLNISSPLVTVYSSLSDDAIIYAFQLSEIVGVMVDEKTLPRLLKYINKLPHLKYVIVSKHIEDTEIPKVDNLTFLTFESLTSYSGSTDSQSQEPKDSNSLAVIMFTSGSTGIPKGVMLSHKNFIAVGASVQKNKIINDYHTYAAFLPSSHVFELFLEFTMIMFGSTIGFCTPLTLLDTSPMIQPGSIGDLVELRPTFMIAVPLFLERVEKGIIEQLRLKSRLKQILFQTCFSMKVAYRAYGFETPVIDKIIFKPLRNLLGGRVRLAFIGGAYISRTNEEFASVCFGNFKQGYGLTETASAVTFNRIDYLTSGTAGSPMPHCEIKLIRWEDGGYDPNDPVRPAGEILISGDSVALGYYKNPELTVESFKIDPQTGKRWFYTGDIGLVMPDGNLKIIDRKKDIIKLQHGEYVSLVKIESKISTHPLVDIVCVLPVKSMQYLVALVVPNRERTFAFLKKIGLANDNSDIQKLLEDASLKTKISDEIIKTIKDLNRYENPQTYFILHDIWTPENNLITPTIKIKRTEISKHYSNFLN